ncbi:hypothetical protein GWK47_027817 [Chionoecetes opilio]|uniref:Uncharacterized protein n=1 Tax=Chionoecetes opilio TaxID=41210 RepID=A0A8J8WBS2_CHIOP|nr:hypothetical protein GWK47_027817 [Chionoecetes opilio]
MEHKTGHWQSSNRPQNTNTLQLLDPSLTLDQKEPPLQMPFSRRPHRSIPLTSSSTTSASGLLVFITTAWGAHSRINSTRRHYRRKPTAQTGRLLSGSCACCQQEKLTFGGSATGYNWCRGSTSTRHSVKCGRQLQVIAGNMRPSDPPTLTLLREAKEARRLICPSHLH